MHCGTTLRNRMAGEAGDSYEITGFSQPSNSSSGQWQPPPRKHCIAQVTGGLGEIYTRIESGWQNADEGGLMAGRYQVIRVLGRGNSSTILQAQDTFRPGLYEVAIKVLKPEYYRLGYQESHLIADLNKADSHNFCGIVKLLNTFTLGSFFCMTFELLRPSPLHQVFKKIMDKTEKLALIRKVALRMLQILGFLGQQNVIHADLKPENILCNSENVCDGIKVIDFGNAIHGVYEELSLYYDKFELQTLLYRAPEVLLGLPFGQEIDMWSLGCILAELYLGKPLFWAKQKEDLLTQMTSLFGPLPTKVYQRAKFFTHFKELVGQPLSFMDNFSKFGTKLGCIDFKFVSFLQGMLAFDPSERMSVSEAIQHPFMAAEMAIKYVLPFKINGSEASCTYSPVDLAPSMYTHAPVGTQDLRNKHLTKLELLHQGARDSYATKQKVIHVVAPFEQSKTKAAESIGFKVELKSEPSDYAVKPGEEKLGGVQLPDAHKKAIKKPLVRQAPVMNKRDVPVETNSSSSEDQHLPEPVLKKDTSKSSKQSSKMQEMPLIGQHVVQVKSVSNSHHVQGKSSENRELTDSPKEDDPLTPHQALKEHKSSDSKSKSSHSEKRILLLDAKSEGTPGSPEESSQQFSYLNQQRVEAVSHRNKSLGVNMKKLFKSPRKIPERCPERNSQRKRDRVKGKPKLTDDVRKSESPLDSKGMVIYDAKKSVHPKKDVTLLMAKDEKKKKVTTKRKSEDLSKGHHRKLSISSMEHKPLKHSAEDTPCQSLVEDTYKHGKRSSVYNFLVTPEKTGQRDRPGSRKRSLQMPGNSMVKRSKTKRVPSGNKETKDPQTDASLRSSEKCLLEALDSNSPSCEMKQSDVRLSPSSKTSSEPTSLTAKMSVLSRLQAASDNKALKHSISSQTVASSSSSSSSSQQVSSSSVQSFKRWSLESSPLVDQQFKKVNTSQRKDDARISHGHSGKRKAKPKAKPLPSTQSLSSLSPLAMPLSSQPSSSSLTSYPLPPKHDTKPSLHPIKQSSPALQIKRLFSASSTSRSASSPRQQRKESPSVESQRTSIKATEALPQDLLSDEEDEILLL